MNERIKKIREATELSQAAFAKRLGLGQSTLAMLEIGKRDILERHIKTICSVFNVNEDWLRTGEGGDENMFRPLFEIDEYSMAAAKIAMGEHNFIKKALIKYSKLSPENQTIIDDFLDSLLNDE